MRKGDKIKEGYTEASNECNMLILKLGDSIHVYYYYSKYRICQYTAFACMCFVVLRNDIEDKKEEETMICRVLA